MEGKKIYQEKLFNNFRLSDHIPKGNFYRLLVSVLDLDYLYTLTKPYYGLSSQKSIDTVMLFKQCLIGYLENIIGDLNLKKGENTLLMAVSEDFGGWLITGRFKNKNGIEIKQ